MPNVCRIQPVRVDTQVSSIYSFISLFPIRVFRMLSRSVQRLGQSVVSKQPIRRFGAHGHGAPDVDVSKPFAMNTKRKQASLVTALSSLALAATGAAAIFLYMANPKRSKKTLTLDSVSLTPEDIDQEKFAKVAKDAAARWDSYRKELVASSPYLAGIAAEIKANTSTLSPAAAAAAARAAAAASSKLEAASGTSQP